jgi:predicted CoA-binding protein
VNIADYQREEAILRALHRRWIAIVGLSANDLRASNFVGRYLLRHGYEVIPVNPREESILGQKSYASLGDIPGPVDVVDVFRHPDAVPDIARAAADIGASCLWLQYNVISEEGADIASAAGMDVVMDRCMKVEHARHMGRMHWLGLNTGQISAKRAMPV